MIATLRRMAARRRIARGLARWRFATRDEFRAATGREPAEGAPSPGDEIAIAAIDPGPRGGRAGIASVPARILRRTAHGAIGVVTGDVDAIGLREGLVTVVLDEQAWELVRRRAPAADNVADLSLERLRRAAA